MEQFTLFLLFAVPAALLLIWRRTQIYGVGLTLIYLILTATIANDHVIAIGHGVLAIGVIINVYRNRHHYLSNV